MELSFTVTRLDHEDLVTLLSDACSFGGFSFDYKKEDYANVPEDKRCGSCFEDKMADILLNGGAIYVTDDEADGEEYGQLPSKVNRNESVTYTVMYKDILKGMQDKGAKKFVLEIENEEDDAITGYMLIQYILFGEQIYG